MIVVCAGPFESTVAICVVFVPMTSSSPTDGNGWLEVLLHPVRISKCSRDAPRFLGSDTLATTPPMAWLSDPTHHKQHRQFGCL